MATALQKQLASIQKSRKNELDLKAQKAAHAKSLLFEPKVAGNQSFDVLYQLCREGFEDLCALDRRFAKYATSLFSQASKSQDRDLLTAKQNEDLNAVLENFLALIGARALLQSAQLGIEWLIRRFQVHEHNTESLVLTFLPYHATPVFLTLMSILPAKLPPTLKFLHRYTNAYSNPPREALVQAAIKNPSFFSALNSYVLKASKNGFHYPVLVSLWASIMVQSVDALLNDSKSGQHGIQQQRSEDLLMRVLPVLNEALTLKKAEEIVVGCHMIVIVLVNKLDLNEQVLDALMSAVALNLSTGSMDSGLASLSLIAERKSTTELPAPALHALFRVVDLDKKLHRLSQEQYIGKLVLGIALGYAKSISERFVPEAPQFFKFAVSNHFLNPADKRVVFDHISKALLENKHRSTDSDEAMHRRIEQVRDEIESQIYLNRDSDHGLSQPEPTDWPLRKTEKEMNPYASNLQQLIENTGIDLKEKNGHLTTLSFLGNSSNALVFEQIAILFENALSSTENLHQFCSLPIFENSAGIPSLPLFTFLAKFWCSQSSITSRGRALQLASEQLKPIQENSLDLQALIPYLLCALADNAPKIRRHAADLTMIISRISLTKGNLPWGKATFSTVDGSALRWLSLKDSSALIKNILLPTLEECLSDANHINVALQQALEKLTSGHVVEKGRVLGKEQKTAIFDFLSSHVLLNQSPSVLLRLLRLLNTVVNVAGSPRSTFLLPCLQDFVTRFEQFASKSSAEGVDITILVQEMLRTASSNHEEAVLYLCRLATDGSLTAGELLRSNAFTRIKTLWPRVPANVLTSVISIMMKAALSSSSHVSCQAQAVTVLKSMPVSSNLLLFTIYDTIQNNHSAKSELASKKRRTQKGSATIVIDLESEERAFLDRLTLVMEMVENSTDQQNIELFQCMFKVLQEIQSYGVQSNSDLAYLTNLTLTTMSTSMHVLTGNLEARRNAAGFVRPDLLVDCIRNTSSPQNRSSALLVLSFLAKQAPQTVLHSIMPIFTMMSATTARLSDEFSAHVVDQTVQDVMPVLVQKLHEEKKDLVSATAEILLSFAAAFEHIPPHRRLQLFKLLASSLGAEETLFAIITALVDAYPANDEVSKFSSTLCRQFGTSISMTAIYQTLDLTLQGLDRGINRAALFQKLTQTNSANIGRDQTIQNLMENILVLLQDPAFQKQLHMDLAIKTDEKIVIEQTLQTAFETIFKIFDQSLPSMKEKSSDILGHLLSLFPFENLARSAQPLLSHPDDIICKSTLNTLQNRIRSSQQGDKNSKAAILGLLSSLTPILKESERPNLHTNVLICIDQICEKFGKADPHAILDAMNVVASVECLENTNLQVQTIAYYCLASSLDTLREDFVPLLKSTENSACTSLAMSLKRNNEKLHNAVLAFFLALTDTIPYMISEECVKTLLDLLQESTVAAFSAEAHESRLQLLRLFSSTLEVPLMARLVLQIWPQAVRRGPLVLRDLVQILKAVIDSQSKTIVSRHARNLFALFTQALDLRCQGMSQPTKFELSEVEPLEQIVVDALLGMVLKINDAIFRPFFSQLLDWSASAAPKRDSDTISMRTITLFNLTYALSERLKSIFTPYFGYVIERISEVLTSDAANIGLRTSALRALTSSFKHDNDDFWQSPSHFDQIIDALPAQLSISEAQNIQAESISAFTEFAVAASSSEHHKEINGRLLKLFRSDNVKTRLAAVKCQQSLTERLGDEWLSNLPEMLPSINELQEDDDEDVEKETNRWIKLIEDKLGESLNSMLQ